VAKCRRDPPPCRFADLTLKCGLRFNFRGTYVFAIIQAAGWPIYFLLIASVIAVAFII
jgi:hypothetical protein